MDSIQTVDGRTKRAKVQRQKRKEQILKLSEKIIGDKGFHNTSVADVLKSANISRGTFYLYFENREALFHELIDGFVVELKSLVKPVPLIDMDPVGKLYTNLVRIIDFLFEHRDLTIILLKEAVGNSHIEGIDHKLNQLYAFLHKMAAGAINNGAKIGIGRKVDEKILSIAMIGSIKEVIYHYLVANRDKAPKTEVIAKELLDFFIKGLIKS